MILSVMPFMPALASKARARRCSALSGDIIAACLAGCRVAVLLGGLRMQDQDQS